jgi:sugar lactone lactonase YvrE
VRRVAVSGQPEGIVAAFGAIWVVRQQAGALSRISPDGRLDATYRIGREPRLVAAGKSALFVSDHGSGTVTRVDPTTGQRRTSGHLCDGPQDLVPYAGTLWVSCTAGDEVIAVDERTMTVTGRVKVPGEPDGLDATGGHLRVVTTSGPTLYELDADPHAPKVTSTTKLGSAAPLQDRANDDLIVTGSTAWVSSFADGAVLRASA